MQAGLGLQRAFLTVRKYRGLDLNGAISLALQDPIPDLGGLVRRRVRVLRKGLAMWQVSGW